MASNRSVHRFFIGTWRMKGFLSEERPVRKLRDILKRLEESYCGSIGYEYMHVPDRDRCNWMRERIETAEKRTYSKKRKTRILVGEIFASEVVAHHSA